MATEGQNLIEVEKMRHLSLALFAWLVAKGRLINRTKVQRKKYTNLIIGEILQQRCPRRMGEEYSQHLMACIG